MSRRSNRGKNTAVQSRIVPAANPKIVQDMAQEYGKTTYGPNAPIVPYAGLQPQFGPRTFSYVPATNLSLQVRDNLTPFEVLRQFSELYDAIRICLQSWFDCAANLEPDIVPVDGLLGKNESPDKYAKEIQVYKDFFERPDQEHTIHEWMNAALEDLAVIDAVCIYPRLNYGGDLIALDLVDGATIKPIIDDRGRMPLPPDYAFEQIIYGSPEELFTADEMLYLKEHNRTKSTFGFSRVENIIMRVNQALRKQNLDMALFTDGNIPAGFIAPAADVGWSPEQLMTYQTMLDSLLSGNDALRQRMKMLPPGAIFTPSNPTEVMTEFDMFLLNTTCASFGTTPAEAGFTDSVNRATGETQEDVIYRRTMRPIAKRFERLFCHILKKYFKETKFKFQWKGYEEKDDFNALVTAHALLVERGIEGPTDALKALKLPIPDGPEIPAFVLLSTGPFVVADLANPQLRNLQVQAQMIGLQMATTTQQDGKESPSSSQVDGAKGGENEGGSESSPQSKGKGATLYRSDPVHQTNGEFGFTGGSHAAHKGHGHGAHSGKAKGTGSKHKGPKLPVRARTHQRLQKLSARMQKLAARPVGKHWSAAQKAAAGKLQGVFSQLADAVAKGGQQQAIDGLLDTAWKQTKTLYAGKASALGAMSHALTSIDKANDKGLLSRAAEVDEEEQDDEDDDEDTIFDLLDEELDALEEEDADESDDTARLARADLRKWRDLAISRIESGRTLRPFVSEYIALSARRRIERALADCTTKEEARMVFARFNENHGSDGRFAGGDGGGGGGGGAGGGLSATELAHVTGGAVNGTNQVTVSVIMGSGMQHFTDSYVAGDVTQLLTSDHAYTFHGGSAALDNAAIELVDHPDSTLQMSDAGTMTLFTNEELSHDQLSTLTDAVGVDVNHLPRVDNTVGHYYDYANYPIDSAGGTVSRAAKPKRTFKRGAIDTPLSDSSWQNTDSEVQAKLKQLQQQNVIESIWHSKPDACEPCTANNGQRRKLGEPFPSGAILTQQHPECNCEQELIYAKHGEKQ